MSKKEMAGRFIAGVLVFGPLYGLGLYIFADTGFSWFETIIVSVLWSAGMVIFETFWQKLKKPSKIQE
jgi:hypothetical protein